MRKTYGAFFLTSLISLGASAPVFAQLDTESTMKLVSFSGQMHLIAEECGDYSASQLEEMKSSQKKEVTSLGISAAEFDAGFETGLNHMKQVLASMDTSAKSELCAQYKAAGK